jgi:DNA protecting protein DprA
MTYPIHCLKKNEMTENHPLKHLFEVQAPPEQLFIQSTPEAFKNLEQLPQKGLAIVGTRNPQPRSIQLIQKSVRDLAQTDLIILSGLARGIDAEAHSAALKAGLPTVAILGTGLDVCYPRENQDLRMQILRAHGAIISEFPFQSPSRGYQFLQRNRLIAGWALATWIVEAAHRSGALNTARWAREQNRTCYTVPCFPDDPALGGNQTLLDRDHAFAFWGVHSLGATWLNLATVQKSPRASNSQLVQYIQSCTYQQGGVIFQELYDWAASIGWSSERFFEEIQSAAQKNLVIERQGTWVSL